MNPTEFNNKILYTNQLSLTIKYYAPTVCMKHNLWQTNLTQPNPTKSNMTSSSLTYHNHAFTNAEAMKICKICFRTEWISWNHIKLKTDTSVKVGLNNILDTCNKDTVHNILATAHMYVTYGNKQTNKQKKIQFKNKILHTNSMYLI
jgi:hypothetical protein